MHVAQRSSYKVGGRCITRMNVRHIRGIWDVKIWGLRKLFYYILKQDLPSPLMLLWNV